MCRYYEKSKISFEVLYSVHGPGPETSILKIEDLS